MHICFHAHLHRRVSKPPPSPPPLLSSHLRAPLSCTLVATATWTALLSAKQAESMTETVEKGEITQGLCVCVWQCVAACSPLQTFDHLKCRESDPWPARHPLQLSPTQCLGNTALTQQVLIVNRDMQQPPLLFIKTTTLHCVALFVWSCMEAEGQPNKPRYLPLREMSAAA